MRTNFIKVGTLLNIKHEVYGLAVVKSISYGIKRADDILFIYLLKVGVISRFPRGRVNDDEVICI